MSKCTRAVMVALLATSPLMAASTLFQEDFETGPVGAYVVGINGWTGTAYLKYSDTVIDQGLSAGSGYDGSVGDAWVTMNKTFTNTVTPGEQLVWSATLWSHNAGGSYAHIELHQSGTVGTVGVMQVYTGYGTLDFAMFDLGGTQLLNARVPQLLVPVDVKVVLSESPYRTDCYYRQHGTAEWTWVTGVDLGLPLASYDNVTVYGHNYDSGEGNGQTDSILLVAESSPPGKASTPLPEDGSAGVAVNFSLSWTPGGGQTTQKVYFGTTNPPPFVASQVDSTYTPPTLAASTTYYWRIDEANNAGTTTGDVWSFTTQGPWSSPDVLFEEYFEGGTPGGYVAGTNGWMGTRFAKYYDTATDQGLAAALLYDVNCASSWPSMTKAFANSLHAGAWLEWNATMAVGNTYGDYAHLELRQTGSSGEQDVMQVFMGYGTLDFRLFGQEVNPLISGRIGQPSVAIDVKVTMVEDPYRTDCYYRPHGETDWTWVAGDNLGLPLASYSRVTVIGHNAEVATGSGVDSIVLRESTALGKAANPWPSDSALGVPVSPELTWAPGTAAKSHDIYFGTTNPPPLIRNQTDATFSPGTLASGTKYYWRVDEVSGTWKTTGDVWSFTTAGPLPPHIMLQEQFEDGTLGDYVVGTNGWTGTAYLKYTAISIDEGYSAGNSLDLTVGTAWPRMSKSFTNTTAGREYLELTATLLAVNTSGDYAHVEMHQAGTVGELGVVQMMTGYGTLDFHLFSMTGSHDISIRPPQISSPVDVKAVLKENPYRTDFFYRVHGAQDWTYAGGDDFGLPLASYDSIGVYGHNYGGAESTGQIDSILLRKVTACSVPFADVDGDNDVDQADFGRFQLCYTGGPNFIPDECACLDVTEPKGSIDNFDLAVFAKCVSGPMVPANADCDQ
ncbi:MAG: hypothetical protein KA354_01905 [Phycisphaerae bacterium]|nr:hypothetical protein [Phycisphaerae bacterium]